MNRLDYNIQLEKVCEKLHLGEIISNPKQLTGGLMHRMYACKTTSGKYAIKALNPSVMTRPEAKNNMIYSEKIVRIAAKSIPALPANIYNDSALQYIEGQYYLVYNWVDGISLSPKDITVTHCEKMGYVLALLHRTDFSEVNLVDDYSSNVEVINWNTYLKKGKECNAVWVEYYESVIEKLYNLTNDVIDASKLLNKDTVISHGDLEPKNVIWDKDKPMIIDWESAGFIHPIFDLLETSLYWARSDKDGVDEAKFSSFLNGYQKISGSITIDWKPVLKKGYMGKLWWLEYSLKRSLWLDCSDKEEQRMGTEQVTWTIKDIEQYESMIPRLEKWLAV